MSMTLTEIERDEPAEKNETELDVNELRLDLFDELAAVRRELYRKSAGDGRIRDESKAAARTAYANAYIRGANATIRLLGAIEDAQVSDRLDRVEDLLDIE